MLPFAVVMTEIMLKSELNTIQKIVDINYDNKVNIWLEISPEGINFLFHTLVDISKQDQVDV